MESNTYTQHWMSYLYLPLDIYYFYSQALMRDGGVKTIMVAFQAIDPGSIPGRRTLNPV